MKFVIFALIAVAALADPAYERFTEWAAQHHRKYGSLEEHQHRFQVFRNNEIKIAALNAQNTGARHAINKFADLTPSEFEQKYLTFGRDVESFVSTPVTQHVANVGAYPAKFDWVTDYGQFVPSPVVTKVKDQASCGSCWAFSTVGTIESAYALRGKLPGLDLSEQQLVSCDNKDSGCSGGLMIRAYNWLLDTTTKDNSLHTEADYPYTSSGGSTGTCRTDVVGTQYKITDYVVISNNFSSTTPPTTPPTTKEVLKQALYDKGPLAVAVYASSSWSSYAGGLFTCTSTASLNHAVMLVGYGVDDTLGRNYYKIKNSWADDWGELGFIRVDEEVSGTTYKEYGPCGLYRYVSYVNVPAA